MAIGKTIEHVPETSDDTPVKSASRATRLFIFIAVVLSLLAAGISFILFQQLQQTRSELSQINLMSSEGVTSKMDGLTKQMEQMRAEQKAFQTQVMTEQENFLSRARQRKTETEAMTRKLEISNQQLLQSMQVLFKQKGREQIGWILAEVEYLLLAANYSLLLQGDINTAVTALKLADERLLDSGDPGTIEIRTKINEEIEQLQAVDQKDLVQLAAKLSANIKMIPQLPIIYTQPVNRDKVEEITPDKATHTAGNLQQAGKEFLKELQNLVVVRQRNQPAQPMITPDEKFFLQQNLQLKLESARYALLSGKQEFFSNSIEEAIDWLETYFDSAASQVSRMKQGLKDLQEHSNTTPVLPNISHSINLLRAYQQEIGNKPAGTDAAGQQGEVKQ